MVKNYTVAITGASGVIYGVRLIQKLLELGTCVNVVISDSGKVVLEDEMGINAGKIHRLFKESFYGLFEDTKRLNYYEVSDMRAPIASGSYKVECMVVAPCTMSSVAAIAGGISKNLIERAADVMLKESRPLIIVPRETPLSTVHLKNMLFLSQCGVKILPAMPGFYNKPLSVDDMINFVVGKTMDLMGIDNSLYRRWQDIE